MIELEDHATELVNELIPMFSKLEFRASISDTSRSIEFFVWINDDRKQCYELADNREIDEKKMETLFDNYAEFVRKSGEYKTGQVNKVSFVRYMSK